MNQRADVPAFLDAFDVALQPKATPYASPLKLFEYPARGVAVLAPRQPNIEEVLAEADFPWELNVEYGMTLEVEGNRLRGSIGGQPLFDVVDSSEPLTAGGVALVCEDGTILTSAVSVEAL